MFVAHYMASGIGGLRTSGDLVARMQFTKKMRLNEAKEYVAKKLGVTTFEMSDEQIMRELREELRIGVVTGVPKAPRGISAKMNIEDLLGIKMNSCEFFRSLINKR